MARVHLFTSSTQPYNYKQGSPNVIAEEPLLSEDIIDNTTIVEGEHNNSNNLDIDTSTNKQSSPSLSNQLATSSAALTAALLQNAHENNDMVGAVAAAFSVKPDTFHINDQQQQQQEEKEIATLETPDDQNDKPEDAMDQAAAATALQLLGLSSQVEEAKDKEAKQATKEMDTNNVMLISNYPGLSSNVVEDIDLNSEEMAQDYKRGTWTREEDELLLAGIKRYGYGRWKEIASSIPGRKGKQLKQRWDNTLASKYVDQEWLRNKIKSDEELHRQQQQQQQQVVSSSSTSTAVEKSDDKALKFLEATDWNDIAIKITEKAREGDQHAIEALLSQALLGSVTATAAAAHHNTSTPASATSTTSSPHQAHQPVVIPAPDSTPSSPKTATADANTTTTTTNDHSSDALNLNFTRSPIDPNNPPSINFADAAALALYAQQLSNSSPSNSTQTLNSSYFLPFNNNNDSSLSAAAAAAVAVVAAQQQQQNQQQGQSQQQQGQQGQQHGQSTVSSPSSSTPTVGQKRRRSDPALADTQSAAMTIYASATPITTTINNQTQTVYPCLFPNCGKTFARLYNLKSHSRTHTDDRPFVCHACTAAFSRNHDLKRHSKIHGGDKPYRCEGCKKSFSRLDALKRHKSNQRNKQGCTDD